MAFQLFHNATRRSIDQPFARRRTRETLNQFWQERPALLSALTLLIGTSFPFFWPPLIGWSLYLAYCRFFPQFALLLGAIGYGWARLPPANLPTTEISALFSPSSLQPAPSPFQRGLIYKGTLSLPNATLPCSLFYKGPEARRPKGNWTFLVVGILQKKNSIDFSFKVKQWTPLTPSRWSLVEFRYQTKERLKRLFNHYLRTPRVALFLSSLITGDVEDRLLRYEFSRLGLQHILAISGFHFGILIAFCSSILGLFLPRAWKIGALFLAVNAYFLFVGSSPSIQRSWLMALFFLLGQWLNRPSNSLNLLGCALCIELMIDPLVSHSIAFQLSFLSCAGILLFHSPIDRLLQTFWPTRTRREIFLLTPLAKHGHLLSHFFRQAISLTLAVNLLLLPLLLYHFHQFPLLSLFYNLFFPFLVSIALFLLLLSLIFLPLCSPLGKLLFSLTNWFTSQLLDLTSHPLTLLDFSLTLSSFPAWILPLFLLSLLFFRSSHEIKSFTLKDLMFLLKNCTDPFSTSSFDGKDPPR